MLIFTPGSVGPDGETGDGGQDPSLTSLGAEMIIDTLHHDQPQKDTRVIKRLQTAGAPHHLQVT